MPTYWHETVGPQFDTNTNVFSISTQGFQMERSPTRQSPGALDRLAIKPYHRSDRPKFDSSLKSHQALKNNAPQTAEDNFAKDNISWIMSLRPLAPTSIT